MAGIAGFALLDTSRKTPRDHLTMWRLMAEPLDAARSFTEERIQCAFDNSISFSEDDDVLVWLDGEIYGAGAETSAHPNDAARLSELYRSNRLAYLPEIDGIFAAVIYDRTRQEIHLINDRYGFRQFYIWQPPGGGIVWASRLRAFLAAPGFDPQIDRVAVADFMEIGYMIEDRSYFEGVSLLSSGSHLALDLRTGRIEQQRYWWWDRIKPIEGPIDEDEIAERLGDLFVQAVQKRVRKNENVGLLLSGGLDSRAILAAMPAYCDPVQTVTFGLEGCQDRVLASRATAVRGAQSHQFALDSQNWLGPRIESVWLTDGQYDLMHMHGVEAGPLILEHFEIDMSGFGGDATIGGSYLRENALDCSITPERAAAFMDCSPDRLRIGDQYSSLNKLDFFFIQNRVRRFLHVAVVLSHSVGLPCRLPFVDNRLMEFVYSLPDALRFKSHIYRKMLLARFPQYFRSIPWQKTGIPISYSESRAKLIHLGRRIRRKLSKLSKGLVQDPFASQGFSNYDLWLREEPARSLFDELFTSPDALYPKYLPRETVTAMWAEHLSGKNHATMLCRYATFEIWLKQAFYGKYRPAHG
jgi:asparagine synthase (glutamine-hydrolysing)